MPPVNAEPVNPIPEEIYPAYSTTSDLPSLTRALVEGPEPIVGEPQEPKTTAGPADPEPSPEPIEPAVRRGRPRKPDPELEALKAQLAALTQTIETRLGKPDPAPTVDPPVAPAPVSAAEPRPKRSDFDDPDAYDAAVDEWRDKEFDRKLAVKDAERAKSAADAAAEKARADGETENQRVIATWNERRTAAAEKYDDYAEVAENEKTPFTTPMLHAVINSEFGPDIAYWLGQNREEAARIAAMPNPINQALAIGRLEAQFASGDLSPSGRVASATDTPPATPPARSNAPRPIRPVNPRSEPAVEAVTEATSQSRIEAHLAELRKQNQPLGWGTVPSGAGRAN